MVGSPYFGKVPFGSYKRRGPILLANFGKQAYYNIALADLSYCSFPYLGL